MSNNKRSGLINLIVAIVFACIVFPLAYFYNEKAQFYLDLFRDTWNPEYLETYTTYSMYLSFSMLFPIIIMVPLAEILNVFVFKAKKWIWISLTHFGFSVALIIVCFFFVNRSPASLNDFWAPVLLVFVFSSQFFLIFSYKKISEYKNQAGNHH